MSETQLIAEQAERRRARKSRKPRAMNVKRELNGRKQRAPSKRSAADKAKRAAAERKRYSERKSAINAERRAARKQAAYYRSAKYLEAQAQGYNQRAVATAVDTEYIRIRGLMLRTGCTSSEALQIVRTSSGKRNYHPNAGKSRAPQIASRGNDPMLTRSILPAHGEPLTLSERNHGDYETHGLTVSDS